ncbi:MAG: PGF-pre-PGF domain-containing protein, partial [Methanoculleus sp.]|nr:PGF-pre-PGF domain-containing protein [Methanoculleus sp.]
GVGTLDATGLFVASGTGTTAVMARAGSVEATAAVTVTAAPTPEPTAEPTTPVSAGSGDSGGDSSPTFDAGMHENLAAGQTFTFSSTTSSVGNVSITAANAIPKLMLTVKKTTPSATEPPAGDIYEYVEITLFWANPDDIDNATIEFTILTAWLEDHDMTPEDVRLMRCVDGAWQPLDTVVLGEENGKYRFRATTPGFSTFAVVAAPVSVTALAEELNVTTEVTGTPEVTGNVTTEPTEAVPATTPTAPLVYAPLLAPLAFLLWARKNH